MPFLLKPFHLILVVLSEYERREQEKQIEYLQVESQILRETIGGSRVPISRENWLAVYQWALALAQSFLA